MKRATLPFALVLLLSLAACKSTQTVTYETRDIHDATKPAHSASTSSRIAAPTGNFDYYLLNLSWSPEYCHSHPDAAECARRSTFVLHGLWPQDNDGSYPQHCATTAAPPDPSQFSDIYPEPGLLIHEWQTHGACTGLSGNDFFTAARAAFQSVKIPPQLANLSSQTSLPPDEIESLFTQANPGLRSESLAISCGHNYLTAVEVCLDKNLHPISCPGVRSCRANTVRIAPPQ